MNGDDHIWFPYETRIVHSPILNGQQPHVPPKSQVDRVVVVTLYCAKHPGEFLDIQRPTYEAGDTKYNQGTDNVQSHQ